jgi:uncharacterized protein (DUF1501 family)
MSQDLHCCEEYQKASALSRRRFLGGMAAAGTAAMSTSLFGQAVQQASFGATRGGNVMVVVSFRGGIDGLGMVVPYSDPNYVALRGSTRITERFVFGQDRGAGLFGLHHGLGPLKKWWDEGSFAAVQAVGMEVPNRSHFVAMELVEDADPGSSLRQGWVNRMVGLGNTDPTAVDAVHLGGSTPPTLVEGPSPTVAAQSLADVQLSLSGGGWAKRRRAHLKTVWKGVGGPLGTAASSALATVDTLGPIGAKSYKPAVPYPREWPSTDFSDAMKNTAQLIKADIGTEVVSVDFGSWDMHDAYGAPDSGDFFQKTNGFARVMAAFLQDLGPLADRVTVVTISEFGRTMKQNGSGGFDHGWGNAMLVLGAGVKGGFHAPDWPGVPNGVTSNELAVRTDYRQVLGEIVHKRFPDKNVTEVFPGISYAPIGVLA